MDALGRHPDFSLLAISGVVLQPYWLVRSLRCSTYTAGNADRFGILPWQVVEIGSLGECTQFEEVPQLGLWSQWYFVFFLLGAS